MLRPTCTLAVLLVLSSAAGCQTSLRNVAKATAGNLDPPNVPAREDAVADTTPAPQPPAAEAIAGEPLVEPTKEQAFQEVLSDLQAIGREDPARQQRLLAQLETADPAHWAPLVQRARSTMQYQQQLAANASGVRTNVLPASTEQRSAITEPGVDREARVIQLGDPGPAPNHGASTTPPAAEFSPYRPAGSADWPIHDPAVHAASAMVFPGPESETQSPYPVTRHAEFALANAAQPQSYRPTTMMPDKDPLHAAIEQLSGRLSHQPQSVGEAYDHVRLRLMQLAAGDLDHAASPPPGLTATEQQYWSNQLLTLSTLLDHKTHPEARRRAAAAGMHLANATEALDQLGSLTVTNLHFCEEVYGFGAYQPTANSGFRPGQEVKVYAEVQNYKSVDTSQGMHTSLATSYRVLDQHGGRVEGGEVPVVNDYCASRRRDFHIQYGITLPEGIYPGKYVLELTLTDQLGDKIGHGALDFEIVSRQP